MKFQVTFACFATREVEAHSLREAIEWAESIKEHKAFVDVLEFDKNGEIEVTDVVPIRKRQINKMENK